MARAIYGEKPPPIGNPESKKGIGISAPQPAEIVRGGKTYSGLNSRQN
jgi:hypothetical protein